LDRHGLFDGLYTTYAYTKNTFLRRFVKRVDKEAIPVAKIHTNPLLAVPMKLSPAKVHTWNNYFDKWVAGQVLKSNSRVFVGWSGMSLHALRAAKKKGMMTVLERGSTHIVQQNAVLQEEYRRFGIDFSVHPDVITKELQEYDEADYIMVPSDFVKKTFIEKGFPGRKVIVNPFGAAHFFAPAAEGTPGKKKFIILYLGTLSIRKGLSYLFEALNRLTIPAVDFEAWFIGSVEDALKPEIEKYKRENWKFFGHINHYDLPSYLSQCDVGVQVSLEEGLSMVIPQMMSSGLPVIITPNTGGENIVRNEISGFVVPVRNIQAIVEKLELLYNDRGKLGNMKEAARKDVSNGFTWNDYGDRYTAFLKDSGFK
jgi:glycosyltransferase involved in cell wall biosynthesis